jgi:RNA polymerase sigma-70 factor (ECF subfamily)
LNPDLQDEEALWRDGASKGDAAALGHIYDAYAERIYYYLYRRLGNVALAEDLTADVFLRVVEARGTPRFCQGALAPWLYRLAHNRLVDYFRQHRELPMPDDLPDPPDETSPVNPGSEIEPGVLRAALRRLTPDQQQVIALKFLEDWSNARVAAALGRTEGAVESLQHRALGALRRILEER